MTKLTTESHNCVVNLSLTECLTCGATLSHTVLAHPFVWPSSLRAGPSVTSSSLSSWLLTRVCVSVCVLMATISLSLAHGWHCSGHWMMQFCAYGWFKVHFYQSVCLPAATETDSASVCVLFSLSPRGSSHFTDIRKNHNVHCTVVYCVIVLAHFKTTLHVVWDSFWTSVCI